MAKYEKPKMDTSHWAGVGRGVVPAKLVYEQASTDAGSVVTTALVGAHQLTLVYKSTADETNEVSEASARALFETVAEASALRQSGG